MILGVLLVELLEVVGLGLVVVEICFEGGQLLGVMGAVGFVVGRGGGLEQALQLRRAAVPGV